MTPPTPSRCGQAASRRGTGAASFAGRHVLAWAVMLILTFVAVMWIVIATAPEDGGAVIGTPLMALLGPLLLSVPWGVTRGLRGVGQPAAPVFWPAAYLLAALLGTPLLAWYNGWFAPGALRPGQAVRDIVGSGVFLGLLALSAAVITAVSKGIGGGCRAAWTDGPGIGDRHHAQEGSAG